MLKKITALGLPFIVIAIGIFITMALINAEKPVASTTPAPPLRTVRAHPVTLESIEYTVSTHGTVQPRTETNLVTEVTGRVLETHPSFVTGGFVDAGDTLLKIDPMTYEANVASAKASLAQAEARLAQEEAEARIARAEWEKYGEGEPNDLVLRKPQLAQASAAVASAKATLSKAEIDLERTVVRAPYAGRLRERFVEEGQFVAAGSMIAAVYSTDYAEVRLPITLDDIAYLDLPLGGTLSDDTVPPRVQLSANLGGEMCKWDARITHTEGEVDPRTRMIVAVARVEDPYHQGENTTTPLLVGMFVEAAITGRSARNVAVIPRRSLRGDSVLVITPDGTLTERKVELLRLGDDDAVIGSGLVDGDRVCTTDLDIFIEGMRVRVAGDDSATSGGSR